MIAAYVQRLRFTFSKTGPARYISHLDLARSFERSLIRANIPVAYSQGFNRRPRMQFAAPLALGVTSSCEIADVWLAEELRPAHFQKQLAAQIAPGLTILNSCEVSLTESALQTQTADAHYEAVLLDEYDADDLSSRISSLLASETFVFERTRGKKRKSIDLRALILDMWMDVGEKKELTVGMHLHLKPGMTGRPDDVLSALGLDPLSARIHRTRIGLALAKFQAAE
jgi:radical SAM-linked protein